VSVRLRRVAGALGIKVVQMAKDVSLGGWVAWFRRVEDGVSEEGEMAFLSLVGGLCWAQVGGSGSVGLWNEICGGLWRRSGREVTTNRLYCIVSV